MGIPPREGWTYHPLSNRDLDVDALKRYLNENLPGKYSVTTERGFYVIRTPRKLTKEELGRIEKAAERKRTPASRRSATAPQNTPPARSPSPKDPVVTKETPVTGWGLVKRKWNEILSWPKNQAP